MPIASIDVHSHALPQAYLDALAELGVDPVAEDGFPTPAWSEEAHLRFMEETGQEFCILSLSTPHIHRGDDAAAARHARAINDELAAVCRRHPGRLGFATTLPVPAVEASIEEARRGFDELGARGVKLPSNGNGIYLGDPVLEPLMAFLDERAAVVTIHPSLPSAVPQGIFTAGPAPLFEYIADTTRAVLNLMAHGVIERYPHIRWVVPHAGSFMPAPKVDSCVMKLTVRSSPPVAVTDERFFFRTVRAAFGQRRKTASNSISAGLGIPKQAVIKAIAECGFSPDIRAEALSMRDLARLSDAVKNNLC